jgi:membrane associated rhomboid family serine protease
MTPKHLAAFATTTLVVVTVSAYLFQILVGGGTVERALGLIPARFSSSGALLAAADGPMAPARWTLLTYMFFHQGWWHVTLNMAGLWFFGRLAEPVMGHARFLSTYLASGAFCGVGIAWLCPDSTTPMVGASGAICGLLGAFLALRIPRWPTWDRRNLAVLAVETACALGVVIVLVAWTPPRTPDRMSSFLWHLLPFLTAWLLVRIGRVAARVWPSGFSAGDAYTESVATHSRSGG